MSAATTPAASLAPSLHDSLLLAADPKLQQTVQLTRMVGEQAAMIKTLSEQLTHCGSDLRTRMKEVARLESSLAESEKNRTFDSTIP